MKVKVGDTWYTVNDGPIMVQLEPHEVETIRNSPEFHDRLARFPPGQELSREEMLKWMHEGYLVELAA